MNKKATISIELLVVLFAIVVVALILLRFGSSLAGQLIEDADIEACKLSVLAQAQTRRIPGVNIDTPGTIVPLDCPRRNLKIFENKVEINGKNSKKYTYKQLTQEQVNEIVAEELRLCWSMMAEGKQNVFEYGYVFESSNTCLICSEIEFDNKLKGKSFEGLLDYLKSKRIPNEKISYFDYLIRSQQNLYFLWGWAPWTQYNPWWYGTTDKIFTDNKLDPTQKYSIYFLAYKPSWLAQFTKTWTTAYYIGLGKEEKLKEECAILVN